MCGLAGTLTGAGLNREASRELRMMLDTISHRGPDDQGEWIDRDAGVALGSRRLAILDISPQGHMPMVSASGNLVLAYNGEIYNFSEIRLELEKCGQRFRGHSDTEVFLAAIDRWGLERALAKVVGMFAFALWDRSNRTLRLVRDRLGEKPLHWARCGQSLLFASELKAFCVHSEWQNQIDRNALALLLRHGYIPAPHTIYRNAKKVVPGTILTFGQDGLLLQESQYWSARQAAETSNRAPFSQKEADVLHELDSSLRRTIRQQMVADVPVGAFLSGGIDSSLVVALMQSESASPVRTFTVGFHERDYDEATFARAVAGHLGTDHTELYVTPTEALETIPRLAMVYDEPFADSSQIPMLLVASLAHQHVKVSLSGDGGDELFGGYTRYHWGVAAWDRISRFPSPIRRVAANAISSAPAGLWNQLARAASPFLAARLRAPKLEPKLRAIADMMSAGTQTEFYRRQVSYWQNPNDVVLFAEEPATFISDPKLWPDFSNPVARMMALDLYTYLPDDIMVKVDRATMAVSLEARAPFLDHRIVELAWKIPMHMKVSHGHGKIVLKQLLAKYVPRSLTDRPKMGFGVPVDEWLRGPLRGWADDLLSEQRLRREGFFQPDKIRRVWEQHRAGAYDHSYALWCVLMFQAWLEQRPSHDGFVQAHSTLGLEAIDNRR